MGDPTIITGAGGLMGQFLSMLGGIAEAGPEELTSGWLGASERAFNTTGSSLSMHVGLVDYGFARTLDHAHIVVHQAGESSDLESIEPRLTTVEGNRVHREMVQARAAHPAAARWNATVAVKPLRTCRKSARRNDLDRLSSVRWPRKMGEIGRRDEY